jgi:hypothetical protein
MVAKAKVDPWKLKAAIIKKGDVVGTSKIEGGVLSYTVTVTPNFREDTYAKVGVTTPGRAWDLQKRWYSNNVWFDEKSKRLVIPKGVTSFSVFILTKDDGIYEPNEAVTLSVNGIEGTAYIRNDAEGIRIWRTGFVQEGEQLTFLVNIIPTKLVTYATFRWGEKTGGDIDIAAPVFSNGVRFDSKTKLLVIPPQVKQFAITFKTFRDGPDLPESISVDVNGVKSVTGLFDATKVSSVTASDAIEGEKSIIKITVAPSNKPSVLPFSLAGGSAYLDDFSNVTVEGATIHGRYLVVPPNTTTIIIRKTATIDGVAEATEVTRVKVGNYSAAGRVFNSAMLRSVVGSEIVEGDDIYFDVVVAAQKAVSFIRISCANSSNVESSDFSEPFQFTAGVTFNKDVGAIQVPAGVSRFRMFRQTTRDRSEGQAESEIISLNVGGILASARIKPALSLKVDGAPMLNPFFGGGLQAGATDPTMEEGNEVFLFFAVPKIEKGTLITLAATYSVSWTPIGAVLVSSAPEYRSATYKVTDENFVAFKFQPWVGPDIAPLTTFEVDVFSNLLSRTTQTARVMITDREVANLLRYAEWASATGNVSGVKDVIRQLETPQYGEYPSQQNGIYYQYAMGKTFTAELGLTRSEPQIKNILDRARTTSETIRQSKEVGITNLIRSIWESLNPTKIYLTPVGSSSDILRTAAEYFDARQSDAVLLAERLKLLTQELAWWQATADPSSAEDAFFATEAVTLVADDGSKVPMSWKTIADALSARITAYAEVLAREVDDLKSSFEQVSAEEAKLRMLAIINATFGALAALGSVGFITSNTWAVMGQVRTSLGTDAAGKAVRASLGNYFSQANSPALAGSFTLFMNNANMSGMWGDAAVRMQRGGMSATLTEAYSLNVAEIEAQQRTLSNAVDLLGGTLTRVAAWLGGKGVFGDVDDYIGTEWKSWSDSKYLSTGSPVNKAGYDLAWYVEVSAPPNHLRPWQVWGIKSGKVQLSKEVKFILPVALDLLGGGLEFDDVGASQAKYDADSDGLRDRVAWIGEGTALLGYDRNRDGLIEATDEISFVGYKPGAKTDLEGLQAFDTNGSGTLDAGDVDWAKFGAWLDADGDGVSDQGEFRSLDEVGITLVDLKSDNKLSSAANGDVTIYGTTTFQWSDGRRGTVGDVAFAYRPSLPPAFGSPNLAA